MSPVRYAVVIPTIGRPSLGVTLRSLAAQATDEAQPPPVEVVVVDDRPLVQDGPEPLDLAAHLPASGAPWPVRVLRSGGRGPAAARNAGWRSVRATWVVFLDDDVELPAGWVRALAGDLAAALPGVGGTQATLVVPLPAHRRPTDWERNTAALERATWATADMAYRVAALAQVSGFDERFPRAYREDADLALRVRDAGWALVRGRRTTRHPVRPAPASVSVRVQAGARDDALMRALHGSRWRARAGTGRGRFGWHVATVGAAGTAVVALAAGRRSAVQVAGWAWLLLTSDFARRRIVPGPRPGQDGWRSEWHRMLTTSATIPFAAVYHRLRGGFAYRRGAGSWPVPVRAVLFDRDGTLIRDQPYNGDPDLVEPVPGARAALDRLRAAGIKVGVITNQSGIGRGLVTSAQVQAVNARVVAQLGPFDSWQQCPHPPAAGCTCRKPGPSLVLRAARQLAVAPYQCAVVGDIGADVEAAVAAGARAVLVPTAHTLAAEVRAAALVRPDLRAAVDALIGAGAADHRTASRPGRGGSR